MDSFVKDCSLSIIVSPVARDPHPFPAIGGRPPLPMAWNPDPGIIIVITPIIIPVIGRVVTVKDRGTQDKGWANKGPKSGAGTGTVTMVWSTPG